MVRVATTSPLVSSSIAGIISSLSADQHRRGDSCDWSAICCCHSGLGSNQSVSGEFFDCGNCCLSEQLVTCDDGTVVSKTLIGMHKTRKIDRCLGISDHERFGTL